MGQNLFYSILVWNMLLGLWSHFRCMVYSLALATKAHSPQHEQHCLKPFDILTGLADKHINSIKGSCHKQRTCSEDVFAAAVIAEVVSAIWRQRYVKLIHGILGSLGTNIFHLYFKGVFPLVSHEGTLAPPPIASLGFTDRKSVV